MMELGNTLLIWRWLQEELSLVFFFFFFFFLYYPVGVSGGMQLQR